MAEGINRTKERLARGEMALGMGVRQARTGDIGMIAEACDFDWLFIDMEHNSMDVDVAAQLCVAALRTSVTPIVRVPSLEHHHASRLLDGGALGIVVPHVDTPEEARRVVANCRFPPAGKRSVGGLLPQLGFKAQPLPELIATINAATLVVVMLETETAVANAAAIAAVEGIDVLMIGASDLSTELGIAGQPGHPKIEAAFRTLVEACRQHGKVAGMGGVYEHGLMQRYIEMGVRFVLGGSDLTLLMAGAKARSGFLRAISV